MAPMGGVLVLVLGRVGLRILYCLDGDTGPGIEDTVCRRLAIPAFIILQWQ